MSTPGYSGKMRVITCLFHWCISICHLKTLNYSSVTCWFRICSYFSLYLTLCLSFLLTVLFIIFSTLFVSLLYTKTNIILIDIRNIEPILFSEVMLRMFLWSTMSTLFHFILDMLLLNMSCKLWYFSSSM